MSNLTTVEAQYSLAIPSQAIALADELKRFVEERKLFTPIQGKKFVNVEGWQFAGGMLGLYPVLHTCDDISDDTQIRYKAVVDLYDMNGMLRGRGMAVCSNKERTKKSFDEYAVASMAQTRAVGKAYRMLLAWVLKAAGYEPTPAEEMDEIAHQTNDANKAPQTDERQKAASSPAPTKKTQQNAPNEQIDVSEWIGRAAQFPMPDGKSKGVILDQLPYATVVAARDHYERKGSALVAIFNDYLDSLPPFAKD